MFCVHVCKCTSWVQVLQSSERALNTPELELQMAVHDQVDAGSHAQVLPELQQQSHRSSPFLFFNDNIQESGVSLFFYS